MIGARPRPMAIGVFAAVAVLSVGALVLSRSVLDNENQRLLADQAAVVGAEVTNDLTAIDTSMRSLGILVSLPGGTDSFAAASAPLLTGNVRTVALLEQRGSEVVPRVVAGDSLSSAGDLGTRRAAFVARALRAPDMVSEVVEQGYRHRLALALALPPDVGPLVVYEESAVDLTNPFEMASIAAPPDLDVEFYASRTADPANLVESTGGPGGSSSIVTHVPVGADLWTLVVSPARPLTGRFAQLTPWLLLAGGLISALLAAAAVQVVLRRRDFAVALVEERTAELRSALTEMRKAQEQAKDAHKALIASERLAAVGEMASVVSHELRNPLSAVINSLFIARGDSTPEATERALALAEREAGKAAAIAEDIVAYARPREPSPTDVVFGSVLAEVLDVLPPPAPVEVEKIGQEVVLYADRLHLVEVMSNLLSNAYDAMPDGGRLTVCAGTFSGDDRSAPGTLVSVSDTGAGIPPDVAAHLFEPFVTAKHHGTGLGLAIVQRIASAHGGSAWADSPQDGGARISVTFPSRPKPFVLVVDDDDGVRRSTSEILEGAGYDVGQASDGMSAMSILEARTVDAMILDLTMPRVGGADVLHALSGEPMPVIVVTGCQLTELPPVVSERAAAVISKPAAPQGILEVLAAVLRARSAPRGLGTEAVGVADR